MKIYDYSTHSGWKYAIDKIVVAIPPSTEYPAEKLDCIINKDAHIQNGEPIEYSLGDGHKLISKTCDDPFIRIIGEDITDNAIVAAVLNSEQTPTLLAMMTERLSDEDITLIADVMYGNVITDRGFPIEQLRSLILNDPNLECNMSIAYQSDKDGGRGSVATGHRYNGEFGLGMQWTDKLNRSNSVGIHVPVTDAEKTTMYWGIEENIRLKVVDETQRAFLKEQGQAKEEPKRHQPSLSME